MSWIGLWVTVKIQFAALRLVNEFHLCSQLLLNAKEKGNSGYLNIRKVFGINCPLFELPEWFYTIVKKAGQKKYRNQAI